MAVILNSANLNSTILYSAILVFTLKLTHTCQHWFLSLAHKWLHSFILNQLDEGSHLEFWHGGFNHSAQKKLIHLFILTQLDDGSHLEFCHVGFSHFAQTSDSNSFIFTHLDDGSHLELCHLGFNHFAQNKLHSFNLTQLDDGSHLEFCHVGFRHCHLGFRHLVIFSQIHLKTLSLLSDSGSLAVIPSHLIWSGSHLEFGHLGFNHLSYSSYTHSHLPRLVPTICTKKTHSLLTFPSLPFGQKIRFITHSFWLNLMMAAILNSVNLNSAIFDSVILHKTLIETNSIWLKLIHSQSTWWWQPSWIQPFCTEKASLIHSDSTWWWQPSLNSAMLDSATAILDSDTLLSSLRFTQKHSHSNLTLTQHNSIWLKLIPSHLTWWWQSSWILPTWIPPSWIQPS